MHCWLKDLCFNSHCRSCVDAYLKKTNQDALSSISLKLLEGKILVDPTGIVCAQKGAPKTLMKRHCDLIAVMGTL